MGEPTVTPGRPDDADLDVCRRVLEALARRPDLCDGGDPRCDAVRDQAARLLRVLRGRRKEEDRQRDRDLLDAAGIRGDPTPQPPPRFGEGEQDGHPSGSPSPRRGGGWGERLSAARRCYVCKEFYDQLHPFYDCLCPPCGDFNHAKRLQTADLSGMTALVTGARVKIGFQTALKLLRAGAAVVATTRFPHDAARRYAAEADFSSWGDRLRLYALDLRHLPAVDAFGTALAADLGRLDVVIHNAAQTVRRPPAFYRHLLDGERNEALSAAARRLLGTGTAATASRSVLTAEGVPWPALLTQLPLLPGDEAEAAHFPPGVLDRDGQQTDLRPHNSWSSELGDVAPIELLEVHAVNSLAPFLLLRRLEPLLFRPSGRGKYVVNVSAMEGQLNAAHKTGRHPHTNMAKAALNMLTRTCAGPYAERGVYMNSVDTGWITNEAPRPAAERMAAEGFREPLDVHDGAARVLDPVFTGLNAGRNVYGKFWKDYRPIPW